MDSKRFDALATALATPRSRRAMMRGTLAGGLASTLAFAGGREHADAKHHKRRKKVAITISNNLTGSILGSSCTGVNDCLIGLVCAGTKKKKTCQACGNGGGCSDAGKCCLVGACVLKGAIPVCV